MASKRRKRNSDARARVIIDDFFKIEPIEEMWTAQKVLSDWQIRQMDENALDVLRPHRKIVKKPRIAKREAVPLSGLIENLQDGNTDRIMQFIDKEESRVPIRKSGRTR